MKNIQELIKAVNDNVTLVWNDPDPIEGNDYTITYVENLDENEFDNDTPIFIMYGKGSEAQVYLHEILAINE
jgi:hypothetical protein